jgi:NAD-dependent DNA ligase
MLESFSEHDATVPSPRSLAGKKVVFTGKLPIKREDAKLRLLQAGGVFQEQVNESTDVVVVGNRSPLYESGRKGQKLKGVDRLNRAGRRIAIIGWDDFTRLTREA